MPSEIEFIDLAPQSAAPTPKRIPLADRNLAIEAKGVKNPRHRPIFISRTIFKVQGLKSQDAVRIPTGRRPLRRSSTSISRRTSTASR